DQTEYYSADGFLPQPGSARRLHHREDLHRDEFRNTHQRQLHRRRRGLATSAPPVRGNLYRPDRRDAVARDTDRATTKPRKRLREHSDQDFYSPWLPASSD